MHPSLTTPQVIVMKPSVRSLFHGAAVACFFTLTLAALAQEKPAAEPPPPPAAEPALRRLDEPTIAKPDDAPPAPTKTKKSRSQQIRERSETIRQRASERAAVEHTGEAIVNVFADSYLAKDAKTDAVVAVFGNATAEGEVLDSVVAVFGDNRVTGPVGRAAVAVFGNSYVNSAVKEGVVVVFGNLELGPDAVIGGEVVCVGGSVTRDPGAVLKRGVKNVLSTKVAWLKTWFEECLLKARPLAFAPQLGWAWGLAFSILAIYALTALLFRTGVERCLTTLQTSPGFSVLAALLTVLLTPVLMVLLVMTGLGIAVVPFLGAGLFFAMIFGKVVVLAWLGRRVTRFFGEGPLNHVAVAVLVGGLIVALLYTVPVLGFLLFKFIGWVGLGAVVYTLVLGMKREKSSTPPPAAPVMTAPAAAVSAGFVGVASAPVVEAAPITSEPPVMPASFPLPGGQPIPAPAIAAATLPRAGFWLRLAAMFIDAILIGIVTGMMLHGGPLMLPALAAYAAAMWKYKGTTIGGIICGLKVVRLDDRPLDWPTSIVRALACFLSMAIAGLGFIWVVFDPEKQSWHDKIAGTTVVRVPKGVSLL